MLELKGHERGHVRWILHLRPILHLANRASNFQRKRMLAKCHCIGSTKVFGILEQELCNNNCDCLDVKHHL